MDGSQSPTGDGQEVLSDTSDSRLSFRVATAALLFLLILSTLLGNTLVCVAVGKFSHLRSKVTNLFVISLAVSDLLVAVLVMPWRAVTDVLGFWPFGAFCDVWVAFDITCSTASILNLCIISVDRYWAVSDPLGYERRMTRRAAFVAVGVAWLLSLLISFIPVQLRWHRGRELLSQQQPGFAVSSQGGTCHSSLGRTYAVSSSLVSFYIPVAIMLVTYARIFCIARQHIRRVSSLGPSQSRHTPQEAALRSSFKKETKVLKTLSVIVGVFVCCWLPFFVLNCVLPFCQPGPHEPGGLPCVSQTVFSTFAWLGWANSSLNPIIYAFNVDFRRAFAALLGCGRPGGAVERVNLSNELVSYHQDSAFQKELVTLSPPQLLPHAVLHVENKEGSSEKVSQVSSASQDAPCAALPLERGTAIALVKVPPRTSSAFH